MKNRAVYVDFNLYCKSQGNRVRQKRKIVVYYS
nr:MAG TPA: hypothetical protein [Caudoviricetes sp.]